MEAKCSVVNCEKAVFARGYCSMHYSRWQRRGDPGDAAPIRQSGRICALDNCGSPARWAGYCIKHAWRLKNHGDPNFSSVIIGNDGARFWEKVDKDGPIPESRPDLGPCWVWLRFITRDGYGRFWRNGKNVPSHIFSYEQKKGPIEQGLEIDHLCRNRACVNPRHLEAVTTRINLLRGDGLPARNARKTHCKRGHPFDEENTLITKAGTRQCRICCRERMQRYRTRKREKHG